MEESPDVHAQSPHVPALARTVREVDVSAMLPEHGGEAAGPDHQGADAADADPADSELAVRTAVERTLDDVDHCPVCAAQAEAYHAWSRFCEARAGGPEPIDELLPTCDEHVAAFLVHGSDRLGERTLANVAPLLRDVLVRTLGELEADGPSSWWARVRVAVLSRRREPSALRARRALHRRPACPVCAMQHDAEIRALDLCALLVRTAPGRRRYERGHGLCLRHLRVAMATGYGPGVSPLLLEQAQLQLELLAWDLHEAGRLDAWTARPLPRASEWESRRRALYRFQGGLERP